MFEQNDREILIKFYFKERNEKCLESYCSGGSSSGSVEMNDYN